MTFSEINVKKVIDDMFLAYRISGKLNNISISESFEENLPAIKGDAERLKQVFLNIVENSLDAMPSGGNLEINGKALEGACSVVFIDNGQGIPEDYIEKIKKPFFTTKPEGMGLGLAVSEKIIKEHKGSMQFSRAPSGTGTAVTITLPFKDE